MVEIGRYDFLIGAIIPAMRERELSPLDRLLSGLGTALSTATNRPARTIRQSPATDVTGGELSTRERSHSAGLMRVNHAGEVAAQGLYQGHAVVSRDPDIARQMRAAADEELDHLGWCKQRLQELESRPSIFSPIWYAGAFAIGAASGVLGDRWSLGFVAETELQVSDHLTGHMEKLPGGDSRSRAIVSKMRDEEIEHGANARAAGASELPGPVKDLMRLTARLMTRTAYWM